MILNMLIRCCHMLPTACHEARVCHPDSTMPIVIQHKAKVATSYTLHMSPAKHNSKGWKFTYGHKLHVVNDALFEGPGICMQHQ